MSVLPSVAPNGITTLDRQALYFVSYDGLVNTNSFQKHGLLTSHGHQYACWYTTDRTAVVARRALGSGAWQTVRLGHTLRYDDSHNVISMGVSATDGRLHLHMDSHSDGFTYVKSRPGLVTDPPGRAAFTASCFEPPRPTLDGLTLTPRFTYPQFLPTPEGGLQLSYRSGISGDGRNALAEYDGSRWTALGEWTSSTGTYATEHGSSTARNMYLHGINYDPRGRLHACFTWREQNPAVASHGGALTNHDTGYVHSDDRGRTWRNDAGTVVGTTGGAERVAVTGPGLVVDPLGPDHSLMNQESQFIDSTGLPHAIISHVPGHVPGRSSRRTSDYVADRTAHGRAFHLRKTASGGWRKTGIPVPPHSSARTKLVLDAHDNAYAILPFGRIAAASKVSAYTDWTLLYDGTGTGTGLNAFGEVVVDETRIAQDGVLSFMYQEKSHGTVPSPLCVADFRLPT
ncbi:BNR repeat-containing protein [Streptomyces sp. NPDC002851]